MQKKYIWLAIAVVVLAAVTVAVFVVIRSRNISSSRIVPHVRLGICTQPANGLLWVAIDQNLFSQEGLDVEVKEFSAGKLALQALAGGSLDLAVSAELPVVLATMNGEKLSTLTQVNETIGGFPVILRKDGEKFDPEVYFTKKRKIGTLLGGGPEFFTNDFLKKHKINPSQYEIVGMKAEDLPIALVNKSVDGIAVFEPFTHFAIEKAGEQNLFVIYDKDLYSETIVLSAKTDWAKSHSDEAVKFILALQKSYDFIKANPQIAMEIVSKHTQLDIDTVKSIWPAFTFGFGLKAGLPTVMQAEAEWAKQTGKIKADIADFDFKQIFFLDPLKKIAPDSVMVL